MELRPHPDGAGSPQEAVCLAVEGLRHASSFFHALLEARVRGDRAGAGLPGCGRHYPRTGPGSVPWPLGSLCKADLERPGTLRLLHETYEPLSLLGKGVGVLLGQGLE